MPRGVEFIFTILILVLILPLLLIVGVIIAFTMGFPILFRQERPGMNGNSFVMYKFRTMQNSVDENGALLPDFDRLGWVGKFLRATSLDELPELWNVLKGDMALVGPRPLLIEYLHLYSEEQSRRHNVRPGITGWAQVNGRNAISWEERFKLDAWYVDNRSIWLDIKILFLTIKKLITRDGISAKGHVTMEKFTGNE